MGWHGLRRPRQFNLPAGGAPRKGRPRMAR